mmetsp:Transcript_22370/g.62020  ORF Transcript_22370/g.62020 Transcript_22370/m.62020 type:complete len:314 (+) Transcript_22370:393-1334(+)
MSCIAGAWPCRGPVSSALRVPEPSLAPAPLGHYSRRPKPTAARTLRLALCASNVNTAGVLPAEEEHARAEDCGVSSRPFSGPATSSVEQLPLSPFAVRTPLGASELEAAAWLRAEAYYEDHAFSRYVETFKKQFMQQELQSLKSRVTAGASGFPECMCFVAIESSSGEEEGEGHGKVVGTLDIRPPAGLVGSTNRQRNMRFLNGVPAGDPHGSYVLNVCVAESHRGQGIGKALMATACGEAYAMWGAQRMYTEVDTWNTAAYSLYKKLGFSPLQNEGSTSSGRQRHLLRAGLPLASPAPSGLSASLCHGGSDK